MICNYYISIIFKFCVGANFKFKLDENNAFRDLLFYNQTMQDSFISYSEILLTDGTYGTLNLGYVLIFFSVIDSNGKTEIVSVGILNQETEENFEWLIDKLIESNPTASKKIKCVMTDKDMVSRKVLKNKLDIETYLCSYHVLCIFKNILEVR